MLTNRKAGSFAWAPDVRKPGLPPNTRRLGDLRLECQVDRAASLMVRPKPAVYYLIEATVDVCSSYPGGRLYYGERAIFNVTLTHGERRQVLLSERLYASKAPTAVLMLCDFYPLLIDRVYLIALPAVVGIEIPIERLIGKLKARWRLCARPVRRLRQRWRRWSSRPSSCRQGRDITSAVQRTYGVPSLCTDIQSCDSRTVFTSSRR